MILNLVPSAALSAMGILALCDRRPVAPIVTTWRIASSMVLIGPFAWTWQICTFLFIAPIQLNLSMS